MFMKKHRARVFSILAAVALVGLVAASCGGDDDDEAEPTLPATTQSAASPTAAATAASEATEAPPTPVGDSTPSDDGATVRAGPSSLVDAAGLTLYVFANDTAGSGTSACNAGCSSAWPPLTVTGEPVAGEDVSGELGTITREDGTTQVTYNGLPLYFFASDTAPGDMNGASIPNWSLAQP
jgi:predicted lipoprotein with Yx(FWY)xxD motif